MWTDPRGSKKFIVIRAPSIVHHFVSDKLKGMRYDRLCSARKSFIEVLSNYMDLKVLPPCFYEHGQGEVALECPSGYMPENCHPQQSTI